MRSRRWLTPMRGLALAGLAAALIAVPLSGASKSRGVPTSLVLGHVSQAVAANYWTAHPSSAPQQLQQRFAGLKAVTARATSHKVVKNVAQGGPTNTVGDEPFTSDNLGLPQNEESISVCKANPKVLLGGTNDYRGLIDPAGNFTGWEYSANSGNTLLKDGLLPPIDTVPSGGDPVSATFGPGCTLYSADLNYDPDNPFGNPNGIGIYKTTPGTIAGASCAPSSPFGLADSDCWPKRRFAAFTANNGEQLEFLDKPWMAVGNSPPFGTAVWVTYSQFRIPGDNGVDNFNASIYAVRCNAGLGTCSKPILISGGDADVQFSDVTIDSDGRTIVSWSQIKGELEGTAQTFVHKLRIAPPGSTTFGPTRLVATERMAIPFGGALQGNDFRIATYMKTTVAPVGDHQRIFAVWDACGERLLDTLCVWPVIKFRYTDDGGATWHGRFLREVKTNYFPTIDYDSTSGRIVVAWYSNDYDQYLSAQAVEAVKIDPATATVLPIGRLTFPTDETQADPTLGGFFIGDYFEVAAQGGKAYVHYNRNIRGLPFLGPLGIGTSPVSQQDNWLTAVGL
jgi:hypothetical protein